MKSLRFALLITLLVFSSCRDAGSGRAKPSSDHEAKDKGTHRMLARDGASDQAKHARKLTISPEVAASVVRVRIAYGGVAPRDHSGALLHRDEIPDKSVKKGRDRWVLALLPGYTERQVTDESTSVVVYRNKVNAGGEQQSRMFHGRVLKYEPSSGLALVTYTDDFDYELDAGFRLERSHSQTSDKDVLSTWAQKPNNTATTAGRYPAAPPYRVDGSQYVPRSDQEGTLEGGTTGDGETPDIAPLVITAPDKLVGFISGDRTASVSITPIGAFSVTVPTLHIEPSSIVFKGVGAFSYTGEKAALMIVSVVNPSAVSEQLRFSVLTKEVDGRPLAELVKPDSESSFELISSVPTDGVAIRGTGELRATIPVPTRDGDEKHYLLQLIWWNARSSPQSASCGKPFKVTLRQQNGGIHPVVEGIPFAGASDGTTKLPETRFTLEAPARSVHPIREGKELLFELDGAPFWKRFSFEKKEWLPLPGDDLSNVRIAGNREALFVLDRRTGEIRRYSLSDLSLQQSAKLPVGKEYVALLAGCNSAHSPVHVLYTSGAFALSPKSLARQDIPSERDQPSGGGMRSFAQGDSFSVYGDGISFWTPKSLFTYQNDGTGITRSAFGFDEPTVSISPSVSAAYSADDELVCSATLNGTPEKVPLWQREKITTMTSMAANCPAVFRLSLGTTETIPPRPARLACIGFFDSEPFAEIDLPEFTGVQPADRTKLNGYRWATFDPQTFQLGTLDLGRTTFIVRQLPTPAEDRQPILLNWPDSSLVRGDVFRYEPLILGKDKRFSVQLEGRPGALTSNATGIVEGKIAPDEAASLHLMTLTIPGKDGSSGLKYSIPLHVMGTRLPTALPPQADHRAGYHLGQRFSSPLTNRNDVKPLETTIYGSPEPIEDVIGPIGGHLALFLEGDRVEFYSLQTKSIVGSIARPPRCSYYSGADALFEYDPAKKSLSRISVPEGKRVQVMNVPQGLELKGIGIGSDRTSPVSLVVQKAREYLPQRPGSGNLTSRTPGDAVFVLDANTLQPGGWGQAVDQSKTPPEQRNQFIEPLYFSHADDIPVSLPVSRNGRVVILPNSFVLLGQSSLICPYEKAPNGQGINQRIMLFGSQSRRMTGSISGLISSTADGRAHRLGTLLPTESGKTDTINHAMAFTACGRYRLSALGSTGSDNSYYVHVRATDTDRELLKITGLSLLSNGENQNHSLTRKRLVTIGEGGDFVLLSASGRAMQVVRLNIPEITRQLSPEDVHIVSQPQFYVVEGSTLDYQLQVNNPQAVAQVHLQNPVPGATLGQNGQFRYTAPRGVKEGAKVDIQIEIVGKDGRKTLQEFPIYILTLPKPGGVRVAELSAGQR